jgi:hypothetical protein
MYNQPTKMVISAMISAGKGTKYKCCHKWEREMMFRDLWWIWTNFLAVTPCGNLLS